MSNNSWILKILSGTHIGAEIVLSDKEAVLGKDESCDLVLDDVSLSGKHISLRSDKSGAHLTLLDTEKPIYIDGEKFTEKTTLLNPFQVITIGTLFLATGPSDAEWPTIDLLWDNKINPAQAKSDDAQKTDDVNDSSRSDEDGIKKAKTKSDDAGKKSFSWAYLLAIVLPIGILLTVLSTWLMMPEDEKHTLLGPEQINRIMLIADKYNTKIDVNEINPNKNLLEITGYIDTEINRKRLLNQLKEIDIHAEIKIISAEKTMYAISAIVDEFLSRDENNHVEVTAVADSPGDFILKGYAKDKAEWSEVIETLKHDVKNYHNLKDEVQTQKDRIEILKQMLADIQLSKQVKISETQQGVVLSGKLNQEQQEQLTRIKEAFNNKFNSKPLAVWALESDNSRNSQIKLDIRGIGFGENPHIIMRNGQHYSEGAQLDNGYTINSITANFIVLKKGKKTEYFYLNAAR